jgi:hypothetical protein
MAQTFIQTRDEAPRDGAVLERLSEKQRDGRVESEHLLADAPKVRQLLKVAVFHLAVEANHTGELALCAPQLVRVPEELAHSPFRTSCPTSKVHSQMFHFITYL